VRVVPKFLQGLVQEQEYQGKFDDFDGDDLEDLPDPELERMKREYLEERLKDEMEWKEEALARKRKAEGELEGATVVEEEEEEEEEGDGVNHKFRKPPAAKKRKVQQPVKGKKKLENEDGKSEKKEEKGESSKKNEGKDQDRKNDEVPGKEKKMKKKKKGSTSSLLSFDVDE